MLLEKILEEVNTLSFEDKEIFFEIFKHRLIDDKRTIIYQNYEKALKNYREGKSKEGTFQDLIKDLEEND